MVSPTRGVADLLDRGGEDADLAGAKFGDVDHLGFQDGELVDAVDGVGLHHADAVALFDDAVHDADHDDDAEVGVIPAVDQHGLEGRVAVALGGGKAGDDGLQHVGDAEAGLGGDRDGVGGVEADDVLDLLLDALGFGGGEVDLVQDGDDLVAGVDAPGRRWRGSAPRPPGEASTTSSEPSTARMRAGDFVGEVDVAGGVDQVQDVGLAVLGRVFDPHGVGLDGDAALALDIHAVQHLRLHVARGDRAGHLDQPVGEGGFAVVDMGHDGEIADVGKVGHAAGYGGVSRGCRGVSRRGEPRPTARPGAAGGLFPAPSPCPARAILPRQRRGKAHPMLQKKRYPSPASMCR